jgi:hypothetical protein
VLLWEKSAARNFGPGTDSVKKFPEMERLLVQAIDRFQAGEAEEAAKLLENILADYGAQAPVLWYFGGCYILHFRSATELAPRSGRASLGLLNALWKTDQIDQALEELERFQVLTGWSCQDYLDIMEEIKEKLDDETLRPNIKRKKKT